MKFYQIILLVAMVSFGANASDKASKQSVEKLLELTEVSKMIDAMYGQVGNMFNGLGQEMGISAEEKPNFDKYMQKLMVLLKEDMNWEVMKPSTIDIYTKHFTQSEVDGLIKFYQSDVGKSMTKKMPLVMQDSMVMSQTLMMKVMPKIQALAEELKTEIAQSRQSNSK
jgi:hypothetical protein